MTEAWLRKQNRTTLSGDPAASAHGGSVQPACGLGLCPARHHSPLWLPSDSALCPCTEGRNGEHSLDVHGCQMCVPPHAHSHPLTTHRLPRTPRCWCAHSHTLLLSHPLSLAHSQHTATCAETHLHCHTRAQGHLCRVVSSHTAMCHVLSPVPSITCAHCHTGAPLVHTRSQPHPRVPTQLLSEPPWHRCRGEHCGPAEPGTRGCFYRAETATNSSHVDSGWL